MDSIATQQSQQPQQQKDIIKIVFLFTLLGISAYATYRISKSLAEEITNRINSQ